MKWMLNPRRADFEGLAKQYGISQLIAKIMVNRGIDSSEQIEMFLHGTMDDLHSPMLLKDMDKAVAMLKSGIEAGKKIRIIGDYDIDGICSAYILQTGLNHAAQGKCDIDVRIPHRVRDGYGLNDHLIEEAIADGVELVITCDNGIAAYDPIRHAKESGLDVIITDHHEVPYEEVDGNRHYILPPADAIVDPKQADCTYPFDGICGGVVAYKVIEALCRENAGGKKAMSDANGTGKNVAADTQAMLEECFAFAAFATVGDVMDLVDENHIIVKFGLDKIKNCRNLGLSALISACELEGKAISPYHIGFVLGPCFNASGRLDDAYRVIDLLNAKSKDEAERLAAELKALNQERQDLTGIGEEAAYAQVEDMDLMKNRVLVVYLPGVHESLAGIIAGRLCNKYYRPTFVLTDGEGCVKGSGRSIEAYHMYDEMTKIKDIFLKYGGHKLAAGLSIASDRVDEFRSRINEVCTLTEADLEEKLILDMHLHIGWVTDEFMDQLMLLEPYGNGNERPVFAERVYISRLRVLGANRNVVRMQIRNDDNSVATGIYFGDGDAVMREYQESAEKKARIAYSPEWNEYQGVRSLQMRIRYLEWY